MCKKIKFLFISAFVLLGIIACNEGSERMPQIIKPSNLSKMKLKISGSFNESDLRSLTISEDIDPSGNVKNRIIWEKDQKLPITVVLRKEDGSGTPIVCKGEGTVVNGKTAGSYDLDFDLETPENSEVDDTWCITGIIGGNVSSDNSKLTMTPVSTIKKGNKTLDIPVSFPWMKLQKSNIITPRVTQVHGVSFKPLGTLLAFDITSEVVDPVKVVGMKIYTSLFTDKGSFNINMKPEIGKSLVFGEDASSNEMQYDISADNMDDLKLESRQSLKGLYLWVMDKTVVSSSDVYLKVGFTFEPVVRSQIIPQVRVGYTPNPAPMSNFETPYVAMWSPDIIPADMSGKVMKIKPKIQAIDPIITEFYKGYFDTNKCTEIVELYNPSIKPIDISQYCLQRQRGWTSYHPSNSSGSNASKQFYQGLMMPIYPQTGHTAFVAEDFDSEIDGMKLDFKTLKGTQSSNMLQPGKTMLLVNNGYFDDETKLDNIKANGLQQSLDRGNIQMIIATKNPNPSKASTEAGSSVLTMGGTDCLLLSKHETQEFYNNNPSSKGVVWERVRDIKTSQIRNFRIVDGYGDFYYKRDSYYAWDVYHLQNGSIYAETRYDGIIYPSVRIVSGHWKFSADKERADYNDFKGDVQRWKLTSIGSRYPFWE